MFSEMLGFFQTINGVTVQKNILFMKAGA
jgi:hypothetical protein